MFMLPFRTVALTMFFLVSLMVRGAGPSNLVVNLEAGKKQTVVAYGTSLTAGGAWVGQLEAVLKEKYPGQAAVINSGGSGQWSKWGVENLADRVLKHNPDTVFIEFSINDSVERFAGSVEIAQGNLENMIGRILASHPQCEIILMTMTPGNKYPPGHRSHRKDLEVHYEMVRTVAREKGFILMDHYVNWKKLQDTHPDLFLELVPDTIHPTAAGCARVVTPVILDALGMAQADPSLKPDTPKKALEP